MVVASKLTGKEYLAHKGKALGSFLGRNVLSEGFEEAAQYAIDKGTEDYFSKKYNKQMIKNGIRWYN
jgi:hypothetical protein